MKITIEHEDAGTVVVSNDGITAGEAVELYYRALLAIGFSPRLVAEWMVDCGEHELRALGVTEEGE